MRLMRAMLLGMSLLGASATWAAAQGVAAVQWYQDEDDRQAFREGYRQGRWDAQHGRRADWDDNRWREADDRRWYREGYLSSNGTCFDIGNTTALALMQFHRERQPYPGSTSPNTAGNGSLMRLAPLPMPCARAFWGMP